MGRKDQKNDLLLYKSNYHLGKIQQTQIPFHDADYVSTVLLDLQDFQ